MDAKAVDIFLHFLNKDTQDIFGRNAANIHLLRLGLNAAVLMCDQCCIIPPGFYFESSATRQLIDSNIGLLTEGLLCFSMKEEFDEYVEKKRKLLRRYRGNPTYDSFFDDAVLRRILDVNPVIIDRSTSVGESCIDEWTSQHRIYLESGDGSFAPIYRAVPDLHDALKIAKALDAAAEHSRGNAFVWAIIAQVFSDCYITDKRFQKELRCAFEKAYFTVYLNEYCANILHDFYLIDRRINFSFHPSNAGNANYRWFEHFLNVLQLGFVLTLPTEKIIFLKKCSPSFGLLLHTYYQILNQAEADTSESVRLFIDLSVKRMLQANENDIQTLVRAVTEEANARLNQIYIPEGHTVAMMENKKEICDEKADVLLIVATEEEEKSILNNDQNWKTNLSSKGTEYFVQTDAGITFALVRGPRMRQTAAAMTGEEFIMLLKPQYIAMVGFCAGRKGKVNLGDVVVADKVYLYDAGKIEADGNRLKEISSYVISDKWLQIVQRLGNTWRDKVPVKRPIDYEYERFCFIRDCTCAKTPIIPAEHWNPAQFPDMGKLIEKYLNEGCVELNSGRLNLTEKGKEQFHNQMTTDYWSGYSAPELTVKVGSIATGSDVQEQPSIFRYLEENYERKTIALDMEANAIGELANHNEMKYIVAKGVGDFAAPGKSFANRFIDYSVFSSYVFIKEFFKAVWARKNNL